MRSPIPCPGAGKAQATLRRRPRLLAPALALLPLMSAGCIFEEVAQEQTELVFESAGTLLHGEMRIFSSSLYRDDENCWRFQIIPAPPVVGPSTLCITLEAGRAFTDATVIELAIDDGNTACIDRNPLRAERRCATIGLYRTGG